MFSIRLVIAAPALLFALACSSGAPTEPAARVQPPVLINDDLAPEGTGTAAQAVGGVGEGSAAAQVVAGNSDTATVCNPSAGTEGCGGDPHAGAPGCCGGAEAGSCPEAAGSGSCGGSDTAVPNCGGPTMADLVEASGEGAPTTRPEDVVTQPGAQLGDVTACLVSGEIFTVTERTAHVTHNGQEIYFCCPGCIRRFTRNPEQYLGH
jgi:YHS domain-containing protein